MRALVRGLRQADADRGVADALGTEAGHQGAKAVRRRGIAGHQHVLLRHAHALEAQVALGRAAAAHLGIRHADRDARRARVDDQRADSLAPPRVAEPREHQRVGALRAERGVALVAVEHERVAVVARGGLDVGGRGSGAGLGDRDREQVLAAGASGKEAALLLLVAEHGDGARRAVQPDLADGRGVEAHPRHLLDEEDAADERRAATAELRRNQQSEPSGRRQHATVLFRELLVLVPVRSLGREPALGERADLGAEGLVLGAELEAKGPPRSAPSNQATVTAMRWHMLLA